MTPPAQSKHDRGCLRRKVEMDMPYVCTCDLTDEDVRIHVEARVAQGDYKDRYGEYPDLSEYC